VVLADAIHEDTCMDRQKVIWFFAAAFLLLILDLACTYATFAVMGMPLGYEMNPIFRRWIIHDGWVISFAKFVLFKSVLFAMCGWLIFYTRSKIFSFIFVQCTVSNHLIAIITHPTLWWGVDWQLRSAVLVTIGLFSLLVTWFGIRFLRAESSVFSSMSSPLPQ
jgi:hypothetical protein